MKPRKPRVLWAFFDCNGCLGEVSASRRRVLQIAYASRYDEGGKAVKFVEEVRGKPRKAKRKSK